MVGREIANVKKDKSHLDKIVPPEINGKYSSNFAEAQKYIDHISKLSYENAIIALVSTFEKILFEKYRNTYGTVKTIVNTHTPAPLNFFKIREKLVKSENDINRLHNILELIKGVLPVALSEQIIKIKNYRDYLAHGKRYGNTVTIEPTLQEIAETLDKVLFEIEKN
jgi:hypothetical protein